MSACSADTCKGALLCHGDSTGSNMERRWSEALPAPEGPTRAHISPGTTMPDDGYRICFCCMVFLSSTCSHKSLQTSAVTWHMHSKNAAASLGQNVVRETELLCAKADWIQGRGRTEQARPLQARSAGYSISIWRSRSDAAVACPSSSSCLPLMWRGTQRLSCLQAACARNTTWDVFSSADTHQVK